MCGVELRFSEFPLAPFGAFRQNPDSRLTRFPNSDAQHSPVAPLGYWPRSVVPDLSGHKIALTVGCDFSTRFPLVWKSCLRLPFHESLGQNSPAHGTPR